MMKILTWLVVGLILVGIYIVTIYNQLIGMIEAIQNNKKQIDI